MSRWIDGFGGEKVSADPEKIGTVQAHLGQRLHTYKVLVNISVAL